MVLLSGPLRVCSMQGSRQEERRLPRPALQTRECCITASCSISLYQPDSIVTILPTCLQGSATQPLSPSQVLPSSGNRSVSLWDVPDKETLQTWLDEFLDVDCSNEVFEVKCRLLHSPPTLLVLWLALAATSLSVRPFRPTRL